MKKKVAIIHGGFHKTASSSIQHGLDLNRDLLRENGFIYPKFSMRDTTFYNCSVPLFGIYTSKPEKFKHYWYHNNFDYREVNQELESLFEQELWSAEKLVFSDEFVSGLSECELNNLKEKFELHGFELRFISFVREPFSFIVSASQQRVKIQGIDKTITSDALNKLVDKIERIKSVFGKAAEFYSFEQACDYEGGPVGFFFSLLGVTADLSASSKVNEAASMHAVRLVDYINTVSPLLESGSSINVIREKDDFLPLLSLKGDKFGLTQREIKLIQPKVDHARTRIAKLLGENFLPEKKVTVVNEPIWSDEHIAQLVCISPNLDLQILLRVYDYFMKLEVKTGIAYKEKCHSLACIIRQRLSNEMVVPSSELCDVFTCSFRLRHVLERIRGFFIAN